MSSATIKINLATQLAHHCIGIPYKWGGQSPVDGYDCSGFVVELLRATGAIRNKDDFTSQGLYQLFQERQQARSNIVAALEGSLVFYGQSPSAITHVAYCIGGGYVIEAGGGDSTTTTRERATQQQAHVRIRPVHYRGDCVAEATPFSKN